MLPLLEKSPKRAEYSVPEEIVEPYYGIVDTWCHLSHVNNSKGTGYRGDERKPYTDQIVPVVLMGILSLTPNILIIPLIQLFDNRWLSLDYFVRLYDQDHSNETNDDSQYVYFENLFFEYAAPKEGDHKSVRKEYANSFAVSGIVESQVEEYVGEKPSEDPEKDGSVHEHRHVQYVMAARFSESVEAEAHDYRNVVNQLLGTDFKSGHRHLD